MPGLRGAKDAKNVETPLLLLGGALLLLLAMVYLRATLRQKRTKQQGLLHEPLQLNSGTPTGVLLTQIGRRKEDLHRFIDKLRTQLAAKEEQLRRHDELEEIVTSRVETSHKQDKEWRKIMKAGKKLHGENWSASNGEQPSLRELMEMHKDELLEYKDVIQDKFSESTARDRAAGGGRKSTRGSRIVQLPVSQSIPVIAASRSIPDLSPGAGVDNGMAASTKVVPPQWQSTRRVAGSIAAARQRSSANRDNSTDSGVVRKSTGNGAGAELVKSTASVPPLDFSKLSIAVSSNNNSSTTAISSSASLLTQPEEEESAPRKSFELTFQRQARFATLLKKK
ncbi:hypothetical protein Gpo141_00014272 [Globisporangium polare]